MKVIFTPEDFRKDGLSYEESWRKMFDEAARASQDDAEITFQRGHSMQRRMETLFDALHDLVPVSGSVLDLGCGPGAYARVMAQYGYNVTGIDYSHPVIAKAHEKSKGTGINYQVADVRSLPFVSKGFNACISVGLFQHLSPNFVAPTINEIVRILKPQGWLFLETLNTFSAKNILRRDFTHMKYNPYHLGKQLAAAGLKPHSLRGVFIFPQKARSLESFFKPIKGLPFPIMPLAHSFMIVAQKDR